jgi:large subunit ribosomal protein L9
MEVILLDKIHNLGDLGDRVQIRAGYGRNYLIPKGRALPATKENIKVFEERRAELEKRAADSLTAAQGRARNLEGLKVTVYARTAQDNRLYGSVGPHEIADAVSAEGTEVEKSEVRMKETGGAIRETGEYEVTLRLHPDVEVLIELVVASQTANA